MPTPRRPIVLLAEDDAGYRFPITAVLKDAGYNVLQVVDGPGLLARHAEADILLVDVRLPSDDEHQRIHEGIDVVRKIRDTVPGDRWQPLIFLSARSEDECFEALKGLPGSYVWLQKPTDDELLLEGIERACQLIAPTGGRGG